MTQHDLSKATRVAASRISEYENGKRDPSVDILLRLLAATGHTIAMVDMADSDFANPYINDARLANVLDLVDAVGGHGGG